MTELHPTVRVVYCTRCQWLARAAWVAQELLQTFSSEIGALTLVPDHKGGVFEVWVDDKRVFSRKSEGGFVQPKELKKRVRDVLVPTRNLGHTDR